MSLSPGTRLGPYEVVSPLGAGGMGEVYRARDTRLDRTVAVKVLPAGLAKDPDRLQRFELEARAVALLSHPNILVLHDVGQYEGAPYLVSEYLQGETLRDILARGPLPLRKAVACAREVASGLAAAHEKGIIHRDLKPENVLITHDSRAKILDFGLAKLARSEPGGFTRAGTTVALLTAPGVLLGTVGYMAPEQVRGEEADPRSDVFAFGTILYEMLTGQRAFRGESGIETLHAILNDEPPDLPESCGPGLERILRHCLEKAPHARFQSARDLAFSLDGLTGTSASGTRALAVREKRTGRWVVAAGVALAAAGLIAAGSLLQRRLAKPSSWTYDRLTFRRGFITGARFAPDGQTIVYSASWNGEPSRIFTTILGSAESRPLDLPDQAVILAISSKGEMAIRLGGYPLRYTLAVASLAGGVPRSLLEDVVEADWSPDGKSLAVARAAPGSRPGANARRLELPPGQVLFETKAPAWIAEPRVSPRGSEVALIEHPSRDPRAFVVSVDASGRSRRLSGPWAAVTGLAWSADGKEIRFSASSDRGHAPVVYAVSLSGRERLIMNSFGHSHVEDSSLDRLLVSHVATTRDGILYGAPGATGERDLTWLDASNLCDLSPDGSLVLFGEIWQGGGPHGGIYLRRTDGSPPVRLGDGWPLSLSRDGKWVAASLTRWTASGGSGAGADLVLLPTGAGEVRRLNTGRVVAKWAWLTPDDARLLISGTEPGRGHRFYVQDGKGGEPRAISPEGVEAGAPSPDGRWVAVSTSDGKLTAYSLDTAAPRTLPPLEPGEVPLQWTSDDRALFVGRLDQVPVDVFQVDLATGRRRLWRSLAPVDRAGITGIKDVLLTPDGGAYAYGFLRRLGDLYAVRLGEPSS